MINGDVQKQKQQRHQPPFSDAYLDGMPPKRRRVSNISVIHVPLVITNRTVGLNVCLAWILVADDTGQTWEPGQHSPVPDRSVKSSCEGRGSGTNQQHGQPQVRGQLQHRTPVSI